MTNSAWLQSKGRAKEAPLQTSWDDAYATSSYDLAKATNDDIDSLEADKDRYFNQLIEQYNHMFNVREDRPKRLLDITKSGLEVKKGVDQWLETEKEIQWFYGELEKTDEAAATWNDPNVPPVESSKRDLYLAARFDKDVAKDLEIEQQKNEIKTEVNDVAYSLLDEGRVEHAQQILRTGEADQAYWRNKHNVLLDEDSRYFPAAAANLKVAMPGYTMADGSQRYMTLTQATTVGEKRYILGKIMANYLHSVKYLQGKRPGRYKREVVLPLIERYKARLKVEYDNIGKAQLEVNERLRAEELESQLENNPGEYIHWMERHKGAYNGSYREARLHGARVISNAAKTGGMSRATIEDLLDHDFVAHDGSTQKVGDYWGEEASIMLKGIGEFEKETMEAETRERKEGALAEFMELKKQFDESDTPPTQDQRAEIRSQIMNNHNISAEQLPDEVKNWYAQGDGDDDLLEYELTKRMNNGEKLRPADLAFSDPMKKAKWLKKITAGGMDSGGLLDRDTFIQGEVDWKTQNTLGENGRGREWLAYKENATIAYNKAYLAAKANGASDEAATIEARKAVTDGLTKNDSWRTYKGLGVNPDDVTQLENAKKALANKPSLLDSKELLPGEEPHVQLAIDYLQDRSANIPQYYRNFPSVKLQPIQLMKRRLTALGLLKDGQLIIPEEEIRPDLQNMFIKPSPARTYRVITDPDQGPDWMIKQYNDGSRDDDEVLNIMHQRIREQSQKAQRFSTTDISYRNTVEIPPELNDEFVAQVGELPVYLQLANLQPEVAKALVADTLMT